MNIARRSLFEDASMLLVFVRMALVSADEVGPLLAKADVLSRKLSRLSESRR